MDRFLISLYVYMFEKRRKSGTIDSLVVADPDVSAPHERCSFVFLLLGSTTNKANAHENLTVFS